MPLMVSLSSFLRLRRVARARPFLAVPVTDTVLPSPGRRGVGGIVFVTRRGACCWCFISNFAAGSLLLFVVLCVVSRLAFPFLSSVVNYLIR